MTHKRRHPHFPEEGPLRGQVVTGGLLLGFVAHHLSFPLLGTGGWGALVFYTLYAGLFVAASLLLEHHRLLRVLTAVSGAAVFAAGLTDSVFAPGRGAELAVYLTSIGYHLVMIVILARYALLAKTVMTDVVLGATALYLIVGSMFGAVYAAIAWGAPENFYVQGGGALDWPQLIYYSYATLTTLGFGDITPRGFYTQALSAFEAVTGVLYTVVLLSRLVGLHSAHRRDHHAS